MKPDESQKPPIVFFSDFGLDSGYVTCMHGVCKRVDPALDLFDGTHLLPAFDISQASFTLQYTVPAWPDGTIFVSVVDPGVGTPRRACVAKLKNGSYVVTPDNGTLTHLDELIGVGEIREIDEAVNRWRGAEEVSVFHGRDLFAFTAARLASGKITFEEVGPNYPLDEVVRFPLAVADVKDGAVTAQVTSFDPFGTLETSIKNSQMAQVGLPSGKTVNVCIKCGDEVIFDKAVFFGTTFGEVPVGDPVVFRDLAGYVSIGLNKDSMAEKLGVSPDADLQVVISQAS